MKTQKSFLLCLSGVCLTLGSGVVSGQQRPPTPPPPPRPAPIPPVPAPTNPLLTPKPTPPPTPIAPKPAAPKIFAYVFIPFETLEPTAQLTPEQSVKVKAVYQKLAADTAATRAAAKTPEEKSALNDKIRAMQTEANKEIGAILTPAQRKKTDGLLYEIAEMISIGVSPQMLHDMKLTPDQRAAILKIVGDVQTKMTALMKDVPEANKRTEYRAKYPAVRDAERVRIPPLLTPAQKAIYDQYDSEGRLLGSRKTGAPKTPAPVAPLPTSPKTAPVEPTPPAPDKKP